MLTDGRTEGQTDMMKLIVTFRNIVNAHKTMEWEKRRAPLKPVQGNLRHFKLEGTNSSSKGVTKARFH